jgi:hypothetical protein
MSTQPMRRVCTNRMSPRQPRRDWFVYLYRDDMYEGRLLGFSTTREAAQAIMETMIRDGFDSDSLSVHHTGELDRIH